LFERKVCGIKLQAIIIKLPMLPVDENHFRELPQVTQWGAG